MGIGKAGNGVTHICQAFPDRVEVRGRDLTGDLMGRVSFTDYFHLLVTGREPSEEQRFFLDLLLVAIAEHGLVPTVAARMTLAADPESLQGAVAAGILGCGPVILGTSELCARLLEEARRAWSRRSAGRGGAATWRRRSATPAAGLPASAIRCTGLSIRAPSAILALADARGVSGRTWRSRASRQRGRRGLGQAADDERLDAHRRGACSTWASPPSMVKAIPLLARTAGLLAHLAEEQEQPDRLPDGGGRGGGGRVRG